jgi:predicted deacylase
MINPSKDLGESFESGETICEIVDSYGRTKETIEAKKPGLVDTYFGPMKVDEGQDVVWTSMKTEDVTEIVEIKGEA